MTAGASPPGGYRNERAYPFCPGCGHGTILDALDAALGTRGTDPARVVLVSDIGCSGLSDQYFETSAFHGLHGRSITYATGIKLVRPDLDVVVLMGDGGTGIGGAHLLSAARRNIGITVVVFNNLNFGMTGGQHSTTTPRGAVTATTPGGNLERPLDIAATVGVNGAQYVWRGSSFDPALAERIAEGMAADGFALLDVWELCTAYYVRSNAYSRRAIETTMEELGLASGVLQRRTAAEFAAEYRRRSDRVPSRPADLDVVHPQAPGPFAGRAGVVVAGAAGGRVRSAVRLAGRAATHAGSWAAQRDDYPVTVRTGHSVSTLVLRDAPIRFPGVSTPELAVVVAAEGLAKVRRMLAGMDPGSLVLTLPEFAELETPARVEVVDPAASERRLPKADLALALLVVGLLRLGLVPLDALRAASATLAPAIAERTAEVVEAAAGLAG
jgi:pyruvate/2-oxoacid:ferredoxin oxidoreductase beta subunit/Pyruvate/2-oxoacid:ferredoxin oxidoreductase gamma subunit